MLYDPSTSAALRSWLVKTLEPICDAEPDALATYVLALLKHDGPEKEMKEEVTKQLDEFFEDGASTFADNLFAALRSKSYVPYSTTPSSSANTGAQGGGIPIPLDALVAPSAPARTSPERGIKRAFDGESGDMRGPPKGPRLVNETYFTRMDADGRTQNSQRSDFGEMNGVGGAHQQGGRVMLPPGVCRDYHLKGYCSRGSMCKYSHDAAALPMQTPMNGNYDMMRMLSSMPFVRELMPHLAYDPNAPQLDMRPQMQSSTGLPMPHASEGSGNGSNGQPPAIQDLTPARSREQGDYQQFSQHPSTANGGSPVSAMAVDQPLSTPNGSSHMNGIPRPTRGYRGRGRGAHGTFGDHQSFSENKDGGRNGKTLVIEKIPDDKLSLEAVNSWFKRFGTVTNVAVDTPGKKALVSFSSHEEARAAWQSEEAIFNNRFVKVFWHRPMGGQGSVGAHALEASASALASMTDSPKAKTHSFEGAPRWSGNASAAVTSLKWSGEAKGKQNSLERQIAEQKELMSKLGSASGEEKKEIMARLRKLNAEMKSPSTSPDPSTEKEKKKKELLDMELEAHAKNTDGEEGQQETRESLEEKLNRLRAEASALGIRTDPPHRGGRGRGRGRASFRGIARGGRPQTSMKLDNRPKALLVKGLPAQDLDILQSVRAWYEAGNSVSSVETLDDNCIIVRFPSRAAAEQGLAKGSNIPSAGSATISWHTDVPLTKTLPTTRPQDTGNKDHAGDEQPQSPKAEDAREEIGWGTEEDDGMGPY